MWDACRHEDAEKIAALNLHGYALPRRSWRFSLVQTYRYKTMMANIIRNNIQDMCEKKGEAVKRT